MPESLYMTSLCRHEGALHLWHGPVPGRDGHPVPVSSAQRVQDEHIEFWGRVFEANNLYAYGVRFDHFITAPQEFLEALARWRSERHADGEFAPLLPAQARVARRIELQTPIGLLAESLENVPTAIMRDGTLIEPLRHHRYPRNHARRASA